MAGPEETGDPEWFEYGTIYFFVGAAVLAVLVGCACCVLASCLGDVDDGGGETDPCCGLQGCFKSCFGALWRTLCCCCNRGATSAANAVTTATNELSDADDAPRRRGGAYDECCGCGDCWKTLTCGLLGGGGKGGGKGARRTRGRAGRGMPPPLPDKPIAIQLNEEGEGGGGGYLEAMRAAGEEAAGERARYSNSSRAPLLAVRVSGAKCV